MGLVLVFLFSLLNAYSDQRSVPLDQSTPAAPYSKHKGTNGKSTSVFEILDTRFLESALEECDNEIECVLARVPVHPSRNCSMAVFGIHHMTGTRLANSLRNALPCQGNITEYIDFGPEKYEYGRPFLHFIRDPLEITVLGYQHHLVSNYSYWETSGIQQKLRSRSLEKGLLMEYRVISSWLLKNALAVYDLATQNRTVQRDFFTIRTDQVKGDDLIFNLTARAIQIWLGIDDSDSATLVEELHSCCFSTKENDTRGRDSALRSAVMDMFADEIYALRKKLDFPRVGLENWTRPKRRVSDILRLLCIICFLVAFSSSLPFCVMVYLSRWGNKILFRIRSTAEIRNVEEPGPGLLHRLRNQYLHEGFWETPIFAFCDPVLGHELDVSQTFTPGPIWKTRIIRLAMLLLSLHVLWVESHLSLAWFYFAYFSQWTFLLTIGYLLGATCVAFFGPLQQLQGNQCTWLRVLVCSYWVRKARTISLSGFQSIAVLHSWAFLYFRCAGVLCHSCNMSICCNDTLLGNLLLHLFSCPTK